MSKQKITVALVGNPNSGKTSIFNNLTHGTEHVGNWPGVTVEKKEGEIITDNYILNIIDLPGTYSLNPYSLEENITRDFIIHEKPDVVINTINTANIERNLYLATQLIDIGVKMILTMNMTDVAFEKGYEINFEKLGKLLGSPVVECIANKNIGTKELISEIVKIYEKKEPIQRHIHITYGQDIENEIHQIQHLLLKNKDIRKKYSTRWLSLKLLENDQEVIAHINNELENSQEILEQAQMSRDLLSKDYKDNVGNILAGLRYGFINGALEEVLTINIDKRKEISKKIDKILMNKFAGLPIFFLIIWGMFQLTFQIGEYPMNWIDSGINLFSDYLTAVMPESFFKSLLIEGIIGGVGSVIIFLPNIVILFLCISFLEDIGYMSRAAFLMDKIMHKFGLHGKSFIPLIMGFGCNVPAIMAARALESKKDRILTILINPFMCCGARFPVFVLFAGAFFPNNSGNVVFSLYLLGIIIGLITGQIMKKAFFKQENYPFVMELPPYLMPTFSTIMKHMWFKAKEYLKKMGGVILVFSIILWFLQTFPETSVEKNNEIQKIISSYDKQIAEIQSDRLSKNKEKINELEIEKGKQIEAKIQENTFIGHIGKFIAPALKPLGFDWQMSVSLIAGFVAKEVVVSSLGVLYQVNEDEEEKFSQILLNKIQSPLVAYAFMVFVLLYVPCIATVAAIKKETASWGWMFLSIFYNTAIAWIFAFIIYQGGKLIGLG